MEDFSKQEMEQLQAVFRDQSLQILDEMCQDILSGESKGGDEEIMSRLKRAAHTLKGDSACVGLDGVTELAHKIEDIFEAMCADGRGFEKRLVDLVLKSLDAMRKAVGSSDMQDIPRSSVKLLLKRLSVAEIRLSKKSRVVSDDERATPGAKDDAVKESQDKRREYVRVEAARIDELLNLACEMVIARSVMGQVGVDLEGALPKNELVMRLSGVSRSMGKLVAELQKSVLKMRMTPVGNVFKRFVRPMRELAAESGKLVELEIIGGETELDRTLVDLLYEPLLHLLRNAVDHGIETVEQREAAGKSAAGKIVMRAYHEGSQVIVEVSDDGGGIDIEAVKARAIEAKLITAADAEHMSCEAAMELIFLQGFSTARQITRVSGRGIGAAAVKSAVDHMRGSIKVNSEQGAGAVFTIRLPLTLAIIKALLFEAAGQLLALPLLSVGEIARARVGDIKRLNGLESYRLRDRFISVVRPGVVLGYERRRGGSGGALRERAAHCFVIVLGAGSKRYGIVAEKLLGEQELVIKALDSDWVENEAVIGGSLLGDGRVVLILDAGMVFNKAVRFERSLGRGEDLYAG